LPYIDNVHTPGTPQSEPPPLDRECGRNADRSDLKLHLADAPNDYLDGALDNPELGPEELAILLRNRAGTSELVARVVRNREWMRQRSIQYAVVCHPRAPNVLARRYLPHLAWRELADVSANLRLSPVLRREAERLLKTRIPELSVGEKIALARRGGRGLVELLRDETDPMVLRALAGNARATEADLIRVLARADAPAGFLAWLSDQSSWGGRRGVRLKLVRHPNTPPASALRSIRGLSRRDLDELRRDVAAPRLVRVAAERLVCRPEAGSAGFEPRFG
jgi:hypothetical protein